mgnify:FL=1
MNRQSAEYKKISESATSVRLKKLAVLCLSGCFVFGGGAVACAAAHGIFAAIAAGVLVLVALGALWGGAFFLRIFLNYRKNAGEYLFAETSSASFECWGVLLAMNVTFRDDRGTTREGISRFLFSPRDIEPWQNVPLEIAYRPGDERIIVIGSAPKRKVSSEK